MDAIFSSWSLADSFENSEPEIESKLKEGTPAYRAFLKAKQVFREDPASIACWTDLRSGIKSFLQTSKGVPMKWTTEPSAGHERFQMIGTTDYPESDGKLAISWYENEDKDIKVGCSTMKEPPPDFKEKYQRLSQ